MSAPDQPTLPPTADLADVFQVLQRYRRLLLLAPFLLAFLTGAASYLLPRQYRAAVLFLPEKATAQGLNGALAGVAGQFGINIGSEGSAPTRLYADLSRSRTLLEALLRSPVRAADGQGERPFIERLVPAEPDSLDRNERALRTLLKAVEVRADIQTGVVRLTLDAPDPVAAADAANRLVTLMSEFNMGSRQTKGRQRRRFTEERAAEAMAELQGAEREMRQLLESNRSVESPRLMNERARLQRQIDIHQQVYLTLARELETARIEEVNDMPVLTVIDAAVPPRRSASPRRVFLVVTAWAVGLVLVGLVVAVAENLRRRGAAGDEDAGRLHDRLLGTLRRVHAMP